jgi:hypothetical protein
MYVLEVKCSLGMISIRAQTVIVALFVVETRSSARCSRSEGADSCTCSLGRGDNQVATTLNPEP